MTPFRISCFLSEARIPIIWVAVISDVSYVMAMSCIILNKCCILCIHLNYSHMEYLVKHVQPHPHATCQCSMIQFNGEDVSWKSFSREQVAADPLHGRTFEHK